MALTPLLTTVKLICEASYGALPHVLTLIDVYLFGGGSNLTLEAASATGCVHLLGLVDKLERSGLDQSFRADRFDAAVKNVIYEGSVEVLEWWLTVYMPERVESAIPLMLAEACDENRLDVLQFLHERGFFDVLEARVDIKCKTPEVANWIHERLRDVTSKTYEVEFKSDGGFMMLQLAYARGIQYYSIVIYGCIADKAAADGHLEALQWIHGTERNFSRCTEQALSLAINSERFDGVQWLYEQYPRGYFCELVHGCANMNTVQWVLDFDEWNFPNERMFYVSRCLSYSRCLATHEPDMIEYLIMACPEADNGTAMEIASKHGDLELVQRLHARGAKSDSRAMDAAASRGHLTVLQWLHQYRNDGCARTKQLSRRRSMDISTLLSGCICTSRSALHPKP